MSTLEVNFFGRRQHQSVIGLVLTVAALGGQNTLLNRNSIFFRQFLGLTLLRVHPPHTSFFGLGVCTYLKKVRRWATD